MSCRLLVRAAAIGALIAGLAGCQEPQRRKAALLQEDEYRYLTPLSAELVGVICPTEDPKDYVVVDFEAMCVDSSGVRVTLPVGAEIETHSYVLVEIKQTVQRGSETREYNYTVLLSADFDRRLPGKGHVRNSAPAIHVSQGWAFVWGRYPFIQTGWVSAGATGSTLAAYVDNQDEVHRIFFLRKTSPDNVLEVEVPPGTRRPPVEERCRYIEVSEGDKLEVLCVGNAPNKFKWNLERLKTVAMLVGWNENVLSNCAIQPCP